MRPFSINGGDSCKLRNGTLIVAHEGRGGRISSVTIAEPNSHPVVIEGRGLKVAMLKPDVRIRHYVTGSIHGVPIQPVACDSAEQSIQLIGALAESLKDPSKAQLQWGTAEEEIPDGNA